MDGSNKPDIPPIAPEDLMPTPATDEDKVRPPTPSLIHCVLGNFASTMLLISLIIFIPFFAVAWLTVFRDAWSMRDQVLSNVLTVIVAVGINPRPRPSTEPRCIRVIHFMGGPRLRSAHRLWGSILALCPYPYGLQTVRWSTRRVPQRVRPSLSMAQSLA